jgi:hypothetical protein
MLGLVGDRRENFTFLITRLQSAVPAEAYALMRNVLEQVVFAENAPGIVSIGAVLALWSGSNVFNNLIDALNHAYDVKQDERPWWKKRLIAIGALLGVGALFVTATIIVVGGEDIVDAVGNYLGIGAVGRAVWATVQFALALGLLVATAFIIYYFLPCVPQRKGHVIAASLLATALGLIGHARLPLVRAELRRLQRDVRHDRRHHRAADVDVLVDGDPPDRRRVRLGAAQGHRRGAHAGRASVRRADLQRRPHRPGECGPRRAAGANSGRRAAGDAPGARRARTRAGGASGRPGRAIARPPGSVGVSHPRVSVLLACVVGGRPSTASRVSRSSPAGAHRRALPGLEPGRHRVHRAAAPRAARTARCVPPRGDHEMDRNRCERPAGDGDDGAPHHRRAPRSRAQHGRPLEPRHTMASPGRTSAWTRRTASA